MESPYDGPVRESRVQVGEWTIRLVRPSDPDRLLDDPEVIAWNQTIDYMPYWAYLWPGAFLLAEVIGRQTWPSGTKALEIGCGLGLPGLVAVAQGVAVRFTDHDVTPLRFVERSLKANGFDPALASTALLDWLDLPEERYQLILGADVTYERRLVPLVTTLLAQLLDKGGEAWLSDPDRHAAETLGESARALGLSHEAMPAQTFSREHGPIAGTIHRIWRPPKNEDVPLRTFSIDQEAYEVKS